MKTQKKLSNLIEITLVRMESIGSGACVSHTPLCHHTLPIHYLIQCLNKGTWGYFAPKKRLKKPILRVISGTVTGDHSSDSTRKAGGVQSYQSDIGGITLAATYYQVGAEEEFSRG